MSFLLIPKKIKFEIRYDLSRLRLLLYISNSNFIKITWLAQTNKKVNWVEIREYGHLVINNDWADALDETGADANGGVLRIDILCEVSKGINIPQIGVDL